MCWCIAAFWLGCVFKQEFHDIDPNFIKLFKLAQLIIEYLLVCEPHYIVIKCNTHSYFLHLQYSQQYLSDHVIELEAKIQDAQKVLLKYQ